MGAIATVAVALAAIRLIEHDDPTYLGVSLISYSLTMALATLWRTGNLQRPIWLLLVRILWVTGAWMLLLIFIMGFFLSL